VAHGHEEPEGEGRTCSAEGKSRVEWRIEEGGE
jgi:hypothetical protein